MERPQNWCVCNNLESCLTPDQSHLEPNPDGTLYFHIINYAGPRKSRRLHLGDLIVIIDNVIKLAMQFGTKKLILLDSEKWIGWNGMTKKSKKEAFERKLSADNGPHTEGNDYWEKRAYNMWEWQNKNLKELIEIIDGPIPIELKIIKLDNDHQRPWQRASINIVKTSDNETIKYYSACKRTFFSSSRLYMFGAPHSNTEPVCRELAGHEQSGKFALKTKKQWTPNNNKYDISYSFDNWSLHKEKGIVGMKEIFLDCTKDKKTVEANPPGTKLISFGFDGLRIGSESVPSCDNWSAENWGDGFLPLSEVLENILSSNVFIGSENAIAHIARMCGIPITLAYPYMTPADSALRDREVRKDFLFKYHKKCYIPTQSGPLPLSLRPICDYLRRAI